MGDYIERKIALEITKRTSGDYATAFAEIRRIPTADVVPVVRAKWIHTKTEEDDWGHSFHHWHCSACGWFEGSNPEGSRKYCSGCGAKMEGVVDNA